MQDALDRRAVAAAVAVLPVLPDVGDVQERRALQPDLDERALHPRQHARDAAQVDVADEPARARSLDVQFLDDALLEHRDAGFLRRYVDEDFMRHRRRKGKGWVEVMAVAANGAAPQPRRGAAPNVGDVYSTVRSRRARSRRSRERQPDDARVAAVEPGDERAGLALDRVRAGLVERLAGGDVALDLARRRARRRSRRWSLISTASSSRHFTATAVSTWCVRPDRCRSIRAASAASAGLPKIDAVEHDLGVGREHGARRQPALSIRCQPIGALVRAMRST